MDEQEFQINQMALAQAGKSSPFNSPMNQYGGSIVLLTNPESELYNFELSLRNMVIDKDGNPKSAGDPLLNEEGISTVLGSVQTIVNRNTVLGNLDDGGVDSMRNYFAETLVKTLMMSQVKYEIKSNSAMEKIYGDAIELVQMCLTRAKDEGERRFWKGSQQEITTRIEGMNTKKKGGMLGNVLGWGGGK